MSRSRSRTSVICVTPLRNEAWILERFLRAAELWADRILVPDQGSKHGSRRIAERFEGSASWRTARRHTTRESDSGCLLMQRARSWGAG